MQKKTINNAISTSKSYRKHGILRDNFISSYYNRLLLYAHPHTSDRQETHSSVAGVANLALLLSLRRSISLYNPSILLHSELTERLQSSSFKNHSCWNLSIISFVAASFRCSSSNRILSNSFTLRTRSPPAGTST